MNGWTLGTARFTLRGWTDAHREWSAAALQDDPSTNHSARSVVKMTNRRRKSQTSQRWNVDFRVV